jgi:hypothetical protein
LCLNTKFLKPAYLFLIPKKRGELILKFFNKKTVEVQEDIFKQASESNDKELKIIKNEFAYMSGLGSMLPNELQGWYNRKAQKFISEKEMLEEENQQFNGAVGIHGELNLENEREVYKF